MSRWFRLIARVLALQTPNFVPGIVPRKQIEKLVEGLDPLVAELGGHPDHFVAIIEPDE
ncbi:MAG: hypothetical protein AMXMBFR33_11990 [Candidatus Xenobia bacterium]